MEEKNLILAVDVGTTETKAVLVSPDGYIDSDQSTCSLSYPDKSCVEQSPKEISDAIYHSSQECSGGTSRSDRSACRPCVHEPDAKHRSGGQRRETPHEHAVLDG